MKGLELLQYEWNRREVMRSTVDATSAMGVAEPSITEYVLVVKRSLKSFSGVTNSV